MACPTSLEPPTPHPEALTRSPHQVAVDRYVFLRPGRVFAGRLARLPSRHRSGAYFKITRPKRYRRPHLHPPRRGGREGVGREGRVNSNNGGLEQTWVIPSLSDPQWAPRNEPLYSSETGITWKTGGGAAVTEWMAL